MICFVFNSFPILVSFHELQYLVKYWLCFSHHMDSLRLPVVLQHFHTIFSASSRWEGSVSVYKMFLTRSSASSRLIPSIGIGPLLAVWNATNFKSSIYWTATNQLKCSVETVVYQRYVSGTCDKSVTFYTFHMKNVVLVHTLMPMWNFSLFYSCQVFFFPQSFC